MPLRYDSFQGGSGGEGGVGGFLKVGEVASVITVGAGSQTVTLPDGEAGPLAENDFVMIFRSSEGTQINLSSFAPSTAGYVAHFTYNAIGVGCRFDYKFLGASPDSSVDIPRHSSQAQAIIIQIWRGVSTATPLLPATATDELATGSSGMPNAGSITSTVDGSKVFAVGWLRDRSIAATISAPAGFGDFLAADEQDASLSAGSSVMVASVTQDPAGAVDPAAFGDSSGNGSDDWAAITFELLAA